MSSSVRIALSLIVLTLGISRPAAAQKLAPTADSLDAISRRGRLLAELDGAAWIATDSLVGRRPAAGSLTGYVAQFRDRRWVVAFGRLNASRDTFFVSYEIIQSIPRTNRYDVVAVTPPRPDTDYNLRASRALDAARRDFGKPNRPYNGAVIEEPDGSIFVYFMPAHTQDGVYPVGGDVRYRFSSDGMTQLEKRQLHNAVLDFSGPGPSNSVLTAGVSTAILDDIPEDTDVFHVLVRQPRVPQYVVSSAFVYLIHTDGRIQLYGRTDEVLARKDSPIRGMKP